MYLMHRSTHVHRNTRASRYARHMMRVVCTQDQGSLFSALTSHLSLPHPGTLVQFGAVGKGRQSWLVGVQWKHCLSLVQQRLLLPGLAPATFSLAWHSSTTTASAEALGTPGQAPSSLSIPEG